MSTLLPNYVLACVKVNTSSATGFLSILLDFFMPNYLEKYFFVGNAVWKLYENCHKKKEYSTNIAV